MPANNFASKAHERVIVIPADPFAAVTRENIAVHMSWLARHTAGMQVIDDEELVVVDSGLATDTFNTICRANLARETMHERIRQVASHYAAVQRPFTWWVSSLDQPADLDAALIKAGFRQVDSFVEMRAELARLQPADLSPVGLRIERAVSEKQIADFALTLASWSSPPDATMLAYYAAVTPALLLPDAPIWLYVGYLGEIPVATAELAVSGEVGGLYNVTTLVPHRRKGIGGAMTLRPLLDAREAGLQQGVLQASELGEPVYRRIGFERTGLCREYQRR